MATSMPDPAENPFDLAHPEQSLEEALDATVRCARRIPFYGGALPDVEVREVKDFTGGVPFTSRVDLSMADGLAELITDPRLVFRGLYPFHQNVCTFPFQVVAGEKDLLQRHERMCAILEAVGFAEAAETLVLTSPPQFFFASDLCAEIFFEGHHCSIQDVSELSPSAIRDRIEAFGAELIVLATDSVALPPEAFPDRVRGLITFRGGYAELARALDVTAVDIYTLTEAPYLGHRMAGERHYRYNGEHFFIERSPAGNVTITSLLWEVMPLIRYQTYDRCGEVRDDEGLVEVTAFGEW